MPRSQAPAVMITERMLQDTIIEMAQTLGWRTYHPWLSVKSASGWPDVTLWRPRDGRFLLVEVKGEKGRLSPEQERTIGELRACGLDVYVWWPSDLRSGEIEEVLR